MRRTSSWVGAVTLAGCSILISAAPAAGQAIITNGSGIYLGVQSLGELNVADGTGGVTLTPSNSGFVGLYYAAVDGDATSPGCLCEGYGVAANGVSGWADQNYGSSNLSSVSFAATPSTATVVTELTSLPGLTVTHQFQPSISSALFEVIVTLTNNTGAAVNDLRYDRTMDWDIPPTTFNEFVTLQGWPATALLHTSDDGFAVPDPLVFTGALCGGAVVNANFTDAGICDHGARFVFGFGSLADGASQTFRIFYGAAPNEALALAALGVVGGEVYSFGQQAGDPAGGTPATFIFGFAGVGGTSVPPGGTVPEPAMLLLFGTAAAAAGLRRRLGA